MGLFTVPILLYVLVATGTAGDSGGEELLLISRFAVVVDTAEKFRSMDELLGCSLYHQLYCLCLWQLEQRDAVGKKYY